MSKDEFQNTHAAFRQEVNKIIKSTDRNLFTNIMSKESYPFLTQLEKEKYIFETALSLTKFYVRATDFLEYLIFEYKINEAIYTSIAHLNRYKPIEDMIEDMFAKRKLADELSQELQKNDINIEKKPKI